MGEKGREGAGQLANRLRNVGPEAQITVMAPV
jgi:hypothetical protein